MIHFGVMNKMVSGQPYGLTKYWAEIREEKKVLDRIEFTDLDSIPESFASLSKYIKSTYIFT